MKITLSVIKADIGSIGGHIQPSEGLMKCVRSFVAERAKGLLIDFYIGSAGDDIHILMTHTLGVDAEKIHALAWDTFQAGTEQAKSEGLYGAGQDLLADAFSGNVRGLGPASAEIEMEERPNEPFLLFAAGAHPLDARRSHVARVERQFVSGGVRHPHHVIRDTIRLALVHAVRRADGQLSL